MPQNQAPPPGGVFSVPPSSQSPLLAFRCAPAIKPYLAEDAGSSAAILIDTPVVYSNIQGAEVIHLPSGSLSNAGTLSVTVSVGGNVLASGTVPLNATAYEISFSLGNLTPQTTPYNLSCEATYSHGSSSTSPQVFSASTALYYLPNPTNSAVTKMDLRTGALLAKPANGQGSYQPVFPIGFYTEFQYLANNLTLIDQLAAQGQTSVDEVFSRIQQNGMYFMYNMRYIYQDAANLTAQVNSFKSWSNLLVWYTGDEPDGSSDPLNATSIAYDLIYNLDGYHPVSLVLNCQDYYFTSYAAGTDIIMEDVYIIGANVNTSLMFDTPCTPTYGDCGCDNCSPIPAGLDSAVPPANASSTPLPANSGLGSFTDVSGRVTSFLNRMQVVGWERTKAVWSVPQAFGGVPGDNYWLRAPTGQEWVVITLLGINHGSLGAISWSDPTPADIKGNASAFALALPRITPFLFNATVVRTNYVGGGVDIAVWSSTNQTLVMATNTYYVSQLVDWGNVGVTGGGATPVFSSGSAMTSYGFTLESMGSAAFLLPTPAISSANSPSSNGAQRTLATSSDVDEYPRHWTFLSYISRPF
ncbi:hypothetical protein J3R83DRAFT_8009 [Lanmaoa asiatica]|nr:hypothetical protein J3R83DRAFT_8009 [Lanmaoa asiatica]